MQAQNYHVIQGKIIDKSTKKGISYVNIGVAGKAIGCVAGDEGEFSFKIPFLAFTDTVQMVYLGYETSKTPLQDMLGKFNTIQMTATANDLNEVRLISNYTVFDLIKDALAKVKDNYYENEPINLITYLSTSDYSQVENKTLKELESYFTIYRPKINGNALAKIKVNKARKKACFGCGMLKTWFFPILLDWVEKDMLFFALKKRNYKKYNYKMTGIALVNNTPNYRILITDKDSIFINNNYAEVFIDTASLAFTKFVSQLNCERLKDEGTPLYKLMYKKLYQKYEVNYQKIGNKWYLLGLDSYVKIMDKSPRDTIHTYTQYKVVEIIKEDVQTLNPLECMHERTIIDEKAMHWDDPAWLEDKKNKSSKTKK